MTAMTDGPGGGTKVLAILGSLFFPIIGIILFFVWRSSPNPAYASLARTCGIIALVIIVINCLRFGVLSVTGGLAGMMGELAAAALPARFGAPGGHGLRVLHLRHSPGSARRS